MNSDQVFDAIETIKQSGGHAKMAILQKYPLMGSYLIAAYDPHTKYYITKSSSGKGEKQFDASTWGILNSLSMRTVTGMNAQSLVTIHTEQLTPKSAVLFNRILNKDLRMGMGAKSINKVFPGLIPTHDIMLAKLFDINHVKYPCFGSPKIDGVRAKFKDGIFYSRNGHEYVGLDHVANQLETIDEELDGELTIPGLTFQQGSGLIRNDSVVPQAQFNIFEIPTLKDTFPFRLLMIDDLHLIGPNIVRVEHKPLHTKEEVMDYYHYCRLAGYEGAVIKPFDYEYKGTRSYDWMKMKPLETVDLTVIDLYEGKGKYKGQLGGLTVNFNDKPNDVGGGFSDKQREFFWNNPNEILGHIIEVEYMEKTDDGNMRHARFIRQRKDKD